MRAHKFFFSLWEKIPATSLFSSQLSRNSLKIFRSYAFPLYWARSLVFKKTGHIFVAYHNESFSGHFFSRTTKNLSLISKLGKGENRDFATRYDNWCYKRRIWHLVLGSSCHIDSTTVLFTRKKHSRPNKNWVYAGQKVLTDRHNP